MYYNFGNYVLYNNWSSKTKDLAFGRPKSPEQELELNRRNMASMGPQTVDIACFQPVVAKEGDTRIVLQAFQDPLHPERLSCQTRLELFSERSGGWVLGAGKSILNEQDTLKLLSPSAKDITQILDRNPKQTQEILRQGAENAFGSLYDVASHDKKEASLKPIAAAELDEMFRTVGKRSVSRNIDTTPGNRGRVSDIEKFRITTDTTEYEYFPEEPGRKASLHISDLTTRSGPILIIDGKKGIVDPTLRLGWDEHQKQQMHENIYDKAMGHEIAPREMVSELFR